MVSKPRRILILSAGAAVALSATMTVLSKEPNLPRPAEAQAAVPKGVATGGAQDKDQDKTWLHLAGRD